jgi:hypothetical protein
MKLPLPRWTRRQDLDWKRLRKPAAIALAAAVLALMLAGLTSYALARFLVLPEDVDLAIAKAPPPAAEPAADAAPQEPDAAPARTKTPSREDLVDPIVRRNIFDSSHAGRDAAAQQPGLGAGEGCDRISTLEVLLLATVVADERHTDQSSALIAPERSENEAQGYGIGDTIEGDAVVVEIRPKQVLVRRSDGTVECISMGNEKNPDRNAARAGSGEDKGDGDVSKLGENKFSVEQAFVDKILESPEALASQIRVVPHKGADGE